MSLASPETATEVQRRPLCYNQRSAEENPYLRDSGVYELAAQTA